MKVTTVVPAYGRDYTSGRAAAADWKAGKDFLIADMQSPWCGRPTSSRDGHGTVTIRYARLTRLVVVPAEGTVPADRVVP